MFEGKCEASPRQEPLLTWHTARVLRVCRNGRHPMETPGRCTACHKERAQRNQRARYRRIPDEFKARTKQWRLDNPKKWAAQLRRRRKQPEPTRPRPVVCESCKRLPNGKGGLHLDHDHVTGEFRGWLCHSCNTALGHLGDNLPGVLGLAVYLLR